MAARRCECESYDEGDSGDDVHHQSSLVRARRAVARNDGCRFQCRKLELIAKLATVTSTHVFLDFSGLRPAVGEGGALRSLDILLG